MQDFVALLNQYVRSELLVVVPVLYVIAKMLNSSNVPNTKIPPILLVISIVLAGLYTFAVMPVDSLHKVLMATFSTLIQGILLSGSAVFSGILGQMMKMKKDGTLHSSQK